MWKVYFKSGFWKHRGRDRAGDEIAVNKRFEWNDKVWHVPAVYVCTAGLVVDYCVEIEPDKMKQFVDKVMVSGMDEAHMSSEKREALENESPFHISFRSEIQVNRVRLRRMSGCSISWMPQDCRPIEDSQLGEMRNESEIEAVLEHYQLDPSKGWVICRQSYSWEFKRKPVIKGLNIQLEQAPISIPVMKFKNPKPGQEVKFAHPVTGTEYIITIQGIELRQLEIKDALRGEHEFPTRYTLMTYTISPELSYAKLLVCDCKKNEAPKKTLPVVKDGACAIGIIGGADGPTAVFFSSGKPKESQLHLACSALLFEPAEEIEWQIVIRVKTCEDFGLRLV